MKRKTQDQIDRESWRSENDQLPPEDQWLTPRYVTDAEAAYLGNRVRTEGSVRLTEKEFDALLATREALLDALSGAIGRCANRCAMFDLENKCHACREAIALVAQIRGK